MREHEYEPIPGLPEELPSDEHIVWQGEPDWRNLARRAFHLRKVALYFALLLSWLLVSQWRDGASVATMTTAASWTVSLAAAALVILGLLAWAQARSAMYTLTNRRLVMRFGVALPMMINLPLSKLQAADLVNHGGSQGDIALSLLPGERASYWALWPHVRPWHFSSPQPMLRGIADAETVAQLLAQQVAATETNPGAIDIAVAPVVNDRGETPAEHAGFGHAALSS